MAHVTELSPRAQLRLRGILPPAGAKDCAAMFAAIQRAEVAGWRVRACAACDGMGYTTPAPGTAEECRECDALGWLAR